MQQPGATSSSEIGLSKLILQRTATLRNRVRRIVALEEVAGSIPVGHPLVFRIDKPIKRKTIGLGFVAGGRWQHCGSNKLAERLVEPSDLVVHVV
jgi:hypothetical protein